MQNPEANIVMENHEFGLPPAHYTLWPKLNDTFDILTTTKDRKGVEYVSTIEHKRFPFFGTQVSNEYSFLDSLKWLTFPACSCYWRT